MSNIKKREELGPLMSAATTLAPVTLQPVVSFSEPQIRLEEDFYALPRKKHTLARVLYMARGGRF